MARFKEPTLEDVKIYFDERWTHYTASTMPPRPSFGLFTATLEYQFFPPDTPENADFIILATGWLHESVWMTVSIPTSKTHLADAVAKYCGLKILNTFPVGCINFPAFATVGMEAWEDLKDDDPKWEAFPLHNGTNMHSLEQSDDHPIRAGTMTADEWHEYETDLMGKIVGEHEWTDEDDKEMRKFKEILKTK
jgi:hypothetical protein